MNCIVVKGKQFVHEVVYDGPGDGVHCVFCQRCWPNREAAMEEIKLLREFVEP